MSFTAFFYGRLPETAEKPGKGAAAKGQREEDLRF